MITETILYLVYQAISSAINLLPNFSGIPDSASSAFNTGIAAIKSMGLFLPVGTLFTVLALIVSFELGVLLYKIVNWVINKTRGSG